MIATTNGPPAALCYARLLRELHRLIAEGKGDSDEADAIREEMDGPGSALSDAERERVAGLSEDLYALAADGVKQACMTPQQRQVWGEEFAAAFQRHDWDRALVLLRRAPTDLPTSAVLFMQARCWEKLADPDTARLFLDVAEQRYLARFAAALAAT